MIINAKKRLEAGLGITAVREMDMDKNQVLDFIREVKTHKEGDTIEFLGGEVIVLGKNMVAFKSNYGVDLIALSMTPHGKPVAMALDDSLLRNIKKYL